MSGRMVGEAFRYDLDPSRKLVLVALADNAADTGKHAGKAWPSRKAIVEKTGLSRATVHRAITDLAEEGLIELGKDERGYECFWLHLSHGETGAASHGATPVSPTDTAKSHSETPMSHGETPYIENPQEPSEEPSGTRNARARDPILAEVCRLLGEICEIRGAPFFEVRHVEQAIADYPNADPVAAAREQRYWLCEGTGRHGPTPDVIGALRGKLQRDSERLARGKPPDRASATATRIDELRARARRRQAEEAKA